MEVKKGGNVDYLITQIKKQQKKNALRWLEVIKNYLIIKTSAEKDLKTKKRGKFVFVENYFTGAGRQVESCAFSHTARLCKQRTHLHFLWPRANAGLPFWHDVGVFELDVAGRWRTLKAREQSVRCAEAADATTATNHLIAVIWVGGGIQCQVAQKHETGFIWLKREARRGENR